VAPLDRRNNFNFNLLSHSHAYSHYNSPRHSSNKLEPHDVKNNAAGEVVKSTCTPLYSGLRYQVRRTPGSLIATLHWVETRGLSFGQSHGNILVECHTSNKYNRFNSNRPTLAVGIDKARAIWLRWFDNLCTVYKRNDQLT
jgi:hypothetical protein